MVDLGSSNPYAPPGSDLDAGRTVAQVGELASRGIRLAAASLDGLVVGVPLVPTAVFVAWQGYKLGRRPVPQPSTDELTTVVIAVAVGALIGLAICIYQWVLIARTGQSLGKKWLCVRIERTDGTPVTFMSGVVTRSWFFGIVGAVPYVGWLFSLVDLVCIFREDRRCLHDHLAGTRVVRVER